MCVHLGQHPYPHLTELARFADMLMKVTGKSTSTSDSLKIKPMRLSSRPSWSSAYAVESNYDNVRNNPAREASKISTSPSDDNHQQSLPPSKDKISYCRVCLLKKHSLMKCPYLLKPADHLQKREDKFKTFDGTIRSAQSRFSPYRGNFRKRNGIIRRWYYRRILWSSLEQWSKSSRSPQYRTEDKFDSTNQPWDSRRINGGQEGLLPTVSTSDPRVPTEPTRVRSILKLPSSPELWSLPSEGQNSTKRVTECAVQEIIWKAILLKYVGRDIAFPASQNWKIRDGKAIHVQM